MEEDMGLYDSFYNADCSPRPYNPINEKLKTVKAAHFEDKRLRLDKLHELLEKDRKFRRGYRDYMEQKLVGMSHSNENHNPARGDPAPISSEIIREARLTEKELAVVFNAAVYPGRHSPKYWVLSAAVLLSTTLTFYLGPQNVDPFLPVAIFLPAIIAAKIIERSESIPARAKRIEETVWHYHKARNGESNPNDPLRMPDNDWAKGPTL
jgi:hypothetical protein